MQGATDFQALSQSHQFQVLRYLQMTGSDNIQQAILHLQQFNMNASQAINHKYSGNQEQNFYEQRPRQAPLNRQQQQQLVKYNNHLRQVYLTTSSPWYIVKYYGGMVKRVARGLTECLMPGWMKKAMFYSKFDKMYKDDSSVQLFERTLADAFKKGIYEEKCLAIIVSNSQKSGDITELLNSEKQVINLLSNRVVTIGVIKDSAQLSKLKCKVNTPSVIFAFQTIFQQFKVLSVHKVNQITENKIKAAITQYRTQRRKQKNIVIRYKNKILSRYNGGEHDMEEEIPQSGSYEHDRLLIEQQRAQYQQASNIRKQSIQKQQHQRVRKLSLVEERKARKLSIPQQPNEGDILVCNFRCPNGTRIDRKFDKNERIQLLYNWVETNQDIEFEEELERKFELLKGYPPEPLKDKIEMRIKEVIDEDREVILIREL